MENQDMQEQSMEQQLAQAKKVGRRRLIVNAVLWAAVIALLAGNVFGILAYTGKRSPKLQQLEDLITEKYIGDADPTELEDAGAEAMIEAMGDRWSYYIPAAEYQAHREIMENAYVGVGITILLDKKEDGFYVQKVSQGGSAEAAGILPGDIIIEIMGQSAKDMESTDAKNLIRGPEGTKVEIAVLRNGEKIPYSLERKTIETEVASGKMVAPDIGMVTIENFDDRCAEESIAAIEDLRSQGAQKLIFDVRFNPGGYAHELVKLLDYLLPEGDLFRTVDYRGREHVDTSDANYLDLPMAVLVNGDSYSAAEFFAAALRDYDAAMIVGEKTCGKGRFQQTFRLNDGSAANISVGNYFTPKGISLDGVGLTPDVELSVDEETALQIIGKTIQPEDDPQLQAAIKALQ